MKFKNNDFGTWMSSKSCPFLTSIHSAGRAATPTRPKKRYNDKAEGHELDMIIDLAAAKASSRMLSNKQALAEGLLG